MSTQGRGQGKQINYSPLTFTEFTTTPRSFVKAYSNICLYVYMWNMTSDLKIFAAICSSYCSFCDKLDEVEIAPCGMCSTQRSVAYSEAEGGGAPALGAGFWVAPKWADRAVFFSMT